MPLDPLPTVGKPGPMNRQRFLQIVQQLKAEGKSVSMTEEERSDIELAEQQLARGETILHVEVRRKAGR